MPTVQHDNTEDTITTDTTSLTAAHEQYDYDDDEEECRLCRGPAEEGRPLYTPCKCSGSIKGTHQDCLEDWLRISGRLNCELCKTKFEFKPRYVDGAPERLPPHEVVSGVLRRATGKWLPFVLRAAIAVSLWLFVIPLATAYIYYGWIHRPGAVLKRWKIELIATDAISGAIVAAVIVVSFLSLMSFADFLRFHWQRVDNEHANAVAAAAAFVDEGDFDDIPHGRAGFRARHEGVHVDRLRFNRNNPNGRNPNVHGRNNLENGGVGADAADFRPRAGDIMGLRPPRDNARQERQQIRINQNQVHIDNDFNLDEDDNDLLPPGDFRMRRALNEHRGHLGAPNMFDGVNVENGLFPMERAGDLPMRRPNVRPAVRVPEFPQNDRFEPQFEPLDPVLDADDAADIHVALDEILGFRGPLGAVIRNMLWLLAFNTTYLGLFAFIPHTVGQTVFSLLSRNRIALSIASYFTRPSMTYILAFGQIITKLNAESQRRNVALQLPDLATITLGYLFMAFLVFLWKTLALAAISFSEMNHVSAQRMNNDNENRNPFLRNDDMGLDPTQVRTTFAHQFKVALECAAAIVKVGVLLFLKMLLLPLLLGVWLDAATLSLFDKTVEERLEHAGSDLFGSMLLHWVVGITFMLLVTVSVLQLREVLHPDILAKVIRPQEPQPDFLGNLLQESGFTHAKRMILSLGIYVALLAVHIWLPAQLLVYVGIDRYLPFFRPHIFHFVLPQLQMPVELLVFHLSMLAFLEKYKNYIGKLQHLFLRRMCDKMGISESILPYSINGFVFLGSRSAYVKIGEEDHVDIQDETNTTPLSTDFNGGKKFKSDTSSSIYLYRADPFWSQLSSMSELSESFIMSHVDRPSESNVYEDGATRRDGQRVLTASSSNIRLARLVPCTQAPDALLIPTSIGPYRLRRRLTDRYMDENNGYESIVIEFWKEVRGEAVSRPPEGWDDLGVGGAEVQGRWAWVDEKRSEIEEGLAKRRPFLECGNIVTFASKIFVLALLFWLGCVLACCMAMNTTLLIGRCIFSILRVPDQWIHDPAGFAIGAGILLPILSFVSKQIENVEGDDSCVTKLRGWISSFRPPESFKKSLVVLSSVTLWLLVCPMCLGILFDLVAITSQEFWSGNVSVSGLGILKSWGSGLLFLHVWGSLCYVGAFTKEFWVAIGLAFNGGEGGNNGNDQNNQNAQGDNQNVEAVDDSRQSMKWQGKNGRIAVFVDVLSSVICGWEWDKVDHVPLLNDCAYPVTRQIMTSLLGSCTAFIANAIISMALLGGVSETPSFSLPIIGVIEKGWYLMILYRASLLVVVTIQMASVFSSPLQSWFQAAHKAARDDRYLVGKILMDYKPPRRKAFSAIA
eukprot:CAMPEP_0172516638 /NCGR_PEP_ID=MMETSP1066-20121228/277912_1 /TAXON_ID=671091 /ORGANISM="Coscinodiscus wailesii, Strain CCMP2513" /LENGTH=1355 /DNA_ID=CAMNT_0013298207 /DNA_START=65 /DNA_END=4132 /DNA_ORIENTATION=+